MSRNFECPICKKPKFKKELITQSISLIKEGSDGVKITMKYKRITCFECNKSRWVAQDGTILRE